MRIISTLNSANKKKKHLKNSLHRKNHMNRERERERMLTSETLLNRSSSIFGANHFYFEIICFKVYFGKKKIKLKEVHKLTNFSINKPFLMEVTSAQNVNNVVERRKFRELIPPIYTIVQICLILVLLPHTSNAYES